MSSEIVVNISTPLLDVNSEELKIPSNGQEASSPRITSSSQNVGYFLIIISVLMLAFSVQLLRIAEFNYEVPTATVVFVRALCHFVFSLCMIIPAKATREELFPASPRIRTFLLLRGIAGTGCLFMVYIAVGKIPAGDTMTIFYLNPAFTQLFSHFLLSEPVSLLDFIVVPVSIFGAFLASHPNGTVSSVSSDDRVQGSAAAALGALLAAVSYTSVRAMGTRVHVLSIMLVFSAISLVVSILLGGVMSWKEFAAYGMGAVATVVSALLTFCEQVSLNAAFQRSPAGRLALLSTTQVPITYVLGLILLNEAPEFQRIVGSILVVSAAVAFAIRKIFAK